MRLVLDSTGLELFGQREWHAPKHARARKRWMKLHPSVDVTMGEVVAYGLIDDHADDATQVPELLHQPDGDIASLMENGAYDSNPVLQAAAARQPGRPPDMVIPPRSSAVPSTADPDKQSPGDRHIRFITDHGRLGWQRMSSYGRRNAAETAAARYNHPIGPKLRARSATTQASKVVLAGLVLNRTIRKAKPVTVRRT